MYVEARREGPMFLERHLVAKFPKSSNMLTFPLGGWGWGLEAIWSSPSFVCFVVQ